ncbi:glutathione hydrolase 5 proenzyme-like isoform X1 [Synchiropus splendidus]|uniref:glutathione hydrolase 5 proenzyme-like isoform X1 n=2 Tax=Synchiropus splendidus TaxID=270530 RepID=UPI00237DAECC|nr:glutathione hydrolase 5 proenzyme-like isoform X1 [Synchiropus splendidus]XP_053709646.1 glutathione hydrolase 5 proenzyme-like isoform X1 [Synchiropus splendidus]
MAQKKAWLVCCFLLSALICVAALVCLCVVSLVDRRCSSSSFKNAAVSADSQICSEIGRKLLQEGGSAVDGAIGALLCTSVVNPQSMGIGGGSIFTVRDKTGNVSVYNFRETAPRSVQKNLLSDCPTRFQLTVDPKWIGVPTELRGYEALHKKYGRLPWSRLFEPTIRLAREGIPMPPYLGKFLQSPIVKQRVKSSSLCEVLCNENKTVLSHGDVLRFPKLAETMETIATLGADTFYSGKIGQDLIQDVRAAGGTLSMEDMESVRVKVTKAWTVSLHDVKLHLPPPPAGGALLAFILKLMEGFNVTENSLDGDRKIHFYHLYATAAKFANNNRRRIYDPEFNSHNGSALLIDPLFISKIREQILSNSSHGENVKTPSDQLGTTHVSVVDEDGLAVSATSTINQLFGAAIYSPRTGVILNNELLDFCGRVDSVGAGEQPPSSMTPVILEWSSGRLLVIGGSGGSLITSAVALSIINHLWLGMNLRDAIAAPILFVDSRNNVNFEPGFDQSVIDGLKAQGHQVGDWKFFLNVVNAVERDNGCFEGASDMRKMGAAAGY